MNVLNIDKRKFTAVSFFSGAGGLDMGFERQGFKVIWANDVDEDACATHRLWSDAKVICGDISKIDFSTIPAGDILLGGWPCQGFSLAGPRKLDDSRNTLYKYYVKYLDKKKPLAFVGENVKGMLTLGDGKIFEAIISDIYKKGYTLFYKLLNAKDYSVPQNRERVIIVGFRNDLGITKFNFPKKHEKIVTLREALADMPEPNLEDICDAPYSSRYMSRNRKRNWDEVSYTIPAMAKQVPLHPSSPDMEKLGRDLWKFGDNGVTRRFSWQEAAAIQTFPRGMEFVGNLTSKYKQIGNAVPVKLAEVVAEEVYKTLCKCLGCQDKELLTEVV
ncbi:DNA (cytosine-5)-methyltransferase 1 [Keratinibaculum paraultunense]|uniref:Cytosine-specific methyltransferase n=1 Tax=Keratinibaculum paraultunense TaxID=1278232 RepID=A0A4R3KVF9_9FIRM|nr:DNA cytosine methyltransferase [Keratinibaculum paraultunense]QQY79257.1 DNA cytosine methyltransferase [Keratinibaculum paraultunense]TCS89389.1 DNA (cytosine-5)-methyltransferase 1 [Keratinibaculum paraultunense]